MKSNTILWFCVGLVLSLCHSWQPSSPTPSPDATAGNDPCAIAAVHYEIEDIPKAEVVKTFQDLDRRGDVRAKMWIVRLKFQGRAGFDWQPEYARSLAEKLIPDLKKLADQGDREAQFLLASAYQSGLGIDSDQKKARELYRKAADAGHLIAMNNLGIMLAHAHGGPPDINEARQWFSKSAKLGAVMAAHNEEKFADTRYIAAVDELRRIPLVQIIGMKTNEAIPFLLKNKLIADPTNFQFIVQSDFDLYLFRHDGIEFNVDRRNDRITDVEGHKGPGFEQYQGPMPLGLAWNATADSVRNTFGSPFSEGDVSSDTAYGMDFRVGNLSFATMFYYDSPNTLKVWRVFEEWATNYPEVNASSER